MGDFPRRCRGCGAANRDRLMHCPACGGNTANRPGPVSGDRGPRRVEPLRGRR